MKKRPVQRKQRAPDRPPAASFLARHSLSLACGLCVAIVAWTAWPALEAPRLEEDDYRYLHHVQRLAADDSARLLDATIVENRWDHLWFVREDGQVRFFRPTVVLSYGLDWWFWGARYPFGLTLTNVLLHLACSLLVAFLLQRWLGPGPAALLSAALFAGLWAHGECIWYVAGRTDSLAALGFLGALALHVAGDDKPSLRWWALPCFAFGFLTKELAVAAPVVVLAYDRLVAKRQTTLTALLRSEWRLYSAYALAAGVVLAVKQLALGGQASDLVHPYFVAPWDTGFLEHLWLQARSYAGNLILAEWVVPFADAAIVAAVHRPAGLVLGVLLLTAAGWYLRHEGLFWFLLLLGVLTWLPVSFVYLSERYLYLPSVAFVGILGLLVAESPPKWRSLLAVGLGLYAAFHTIQLHDKHRTIVRQPGSVAEMAAQLEPVREQIARGGRLLLVNVPGQLFRAQFMQEVLRVLLDDPELTARVVTVMPGQNAPASRSGVAFVPAMGAEVQLKRSGPSRFTLDGNSLAPGQRAQHVQEYGLTPFAWSRLDRPAVYETPSLEARIVAGDTAGATRLEIALPAPLERYQILVWEAGGSDPTKDTWDRRRRAKVRVAELE